MYKKFFGLSDNPFKLVPEPRYVFSTARTDEILANLIHGVQSHKGVILLTGEVGTGKTVLLKRLIDGLNRDATAVAFVFDPRLNPAEFLDYVLSDFGILHDTKEKELMVRSLYQWLQGRHRVSQTSVLIVDEAHDLSDEILEEISLISNLGTPADKLLQIILSGLPEIERKLIRPKTEQFATSIALQQRTSALSLDETSAYIAHRIRAANGDPARIFYPEATASIFGLSQGIPRVINLLCEYALICAYADEERPVGVAKVEEAALQFLPITEVVPFLYAPIGLPEEGEFGSLSPSREGTTAITDFSAPVEKPVILHVPLEPQTSGETLGRLTSPEVAVPLSRQSQIDSPAPAGVSAKVQGPTPISEEKVNPAEGPVLEKGPLDVDWPRRLLEIGNAAYYRTSTDPRSPPRNPNESTKDIEKPVPMSAREELVRATEPRRNARSPVPQISSRTSSGSPSSLTIPTLTRKEAVAHAYVPRPGSGIGQRPRNVKRAAPVNVNLRFGQPATGSHRHPTSFLWFAAVFLAIGMTLAGYYAFNKNQSVLLQLWQRDTSKNHSAITVSPPEKPPTPAPTAKTPPGLAAPQKGAADVKVAGSSTIPAHTRAEQPRGPFSGRAPGKVRANLPEAEVVNRSQAAPTVEPLYPAAPSEGRLRVTSSIPGATITLDGRSESNWITPHTFTNLPAGSHEVIIFKQGYRKIGQSADVKAGTLLTINATLVIPSGELKISTDPPGAEVAIDGRSYGLSPVRANLKTGEHSFSARLAGHETVRGNVMVEDWALVTKTLTLPPLLASRPQINVEVTTNPPKATVYADGLPKGTTPLSFHMLPGHHTLIIYASGFRPVRREIEVPEIGVATVKQPLIAE